VVTHPADAKIVAAVACSFCGAEAGQPCRWQKIHTKGQTHTARRLAWERLIEDQREEPRRSLEDRICSIRRAEEAVALVPEIVALKDGGLLHELWWGHWREHGFGKVPVGTWPKLKPCPTCGEQAVVRIIYGIQPLEPPAAAARARSFWRVPSPPPDRRRKWSVAPAARPSEGCGPEPYHSPSSSGDSLRGLLRLRCRAVAVQTNPPPLAGHSGRRCRTGRTRCRSCDRPASRDDCGTPARIKFRTAVRRRSCAGAGHPADRQAAFHDLATLAYGCGVFVPPSRRASLGHFPEEDVAGRGARPS